MRGRTRNASSQMLHDRNGERAPSASRRSRGLAVLLVAAALGPGCTDRSSKPEDLTSSLFGVVVQLPGDRGTRVAIEYLDGSRPEYAAPGRIAPFGSAADLAAFVATIDEADLFHYPTPGTSGLSARYLIGSTLTLSGRALSYDQLTKLHTQGTQHLALKPGDELALRGRPSPAPDSGTPATAVEATARLPGTFAITKPTTKATWTRDRAQVELAWQAASHADFYIAVLSSIAFPKAATLRFVPAAEPRQLTVDLGRYGTAPVRIEIIAFGGTSLEQREPKHWVATPNVRGVDRGLFVGATLDALDVTHAKATRP